MCIKYDRYTKWIKSLPKKTKGKNTIQHWILPESIGGTNTKENKIYLTHENHITAHEKLAECFKSPKKDKMKKSLIEAQLEEHLYKANSNRLGE